MRISPSDLRFGLRTVLAGLALAVLPLTGLDAQERTVVSKTVTVGDREAAMALELSGGGDLAISFRDGEVRIDDRVVGSYEAGGSLESAWRSLLGIAIALDDGPLGTALVGWLPPSGLRGESAELAARIDDALETAFAAPAAASAPAAETVVAANAAADAAEAPTTTAVDAAPAPRTFEPIEFGRRLQDGIDGGTLGSLLLRLDRLTALADGIETLASDGDDVRVLIDEKVRIGRDQEMVSPLLIIDGDIEIAGALSSDLVVLDGHVRLLESGVVNGDIQLAESEFVNEGGQLLGSVRSIEIGDASIAEEITRGIRDAQIDARDSGRSRGILHGPMTFVGNVGHAFGGVFGNLLTILIFGVGGWGILYFASNNLDAIAETSRRASGRSFTVGMAGAFLAVPAWILGIVGLAISIIGIPGLILWIPFFPVAVALAIGLGYVAVAHNLGAWLSRQRFPGFGWVRITNAYTLILGGMFVLFAPWIAANVLHVGGGWFGGLRTFLHVCGIVMNGVAALIGFGAVLTTRGGRKPEYWPDDLFGGSTTSSSRRRRTAGRGFDPSGFESSTGWADPVDTSMEDAAPEAPEASNADEAPTAEADAPAPKKKSSGGRSKKSTTASDEAKGGEDDAD